MEELPKKLILKKAKTHKGRLAISQKLGKLVEDPKINLLINTNNSSEIMRLVLNDLYLMFKEFSKKLMKKNKIESVFTTKKDIEYLLEKNNAAIFVYTSDTKKKGMNIVFGNSFNFKVMDSFEFEMLNFINIDHFSQFIKVDSSIKPIIIFQGEVFETDKEYERIKNFFLDLFKLRNINDIDIKGLNRIIAVSCGEDKIIKIRCFEVDKISEYIVYYFFYLSS